MDTAATGKDLMVSLWTSTNLTGASLANPATQPGVRTRVIRNPGVGGGKRSVTLSLYETTAHAYCASLAAIGVLNTSHALVPSSTSIVPTQQWFFNIQINNAIDVPFTSSTPTMDYKIRVYLKYYCKMWALNFAPYQSLQQIQEEETIDTEFDPDDNGAVPDIGTVF